MENKVIQLENKNGVAVVSSRVVANDFRKRHDSVLRNIESLTSEMSTPQNCGLFIESQYKASNGKMNKEYLLTRDGFSLLVMGFTGKEALQWKLQYIEAFNKMEEQIKNQMNNTSNVPQLTQEKQLILELFDKRNNPAEFVLAVGNYGDYKFEEGGRFICNESIITLPRVAEMIQHTLQDELEKLNYHPIMTQLGSEFVRFLIQEGYLEPRLFPSTSGWGTEKRRHNQPTQAFYDVFVSQAMATAREIADGRGKVEVSFTNNVYKYILSDAFKTNFMKFIYKTHPLLVELMKSNSVSLV